MKKTKMLLVAIFTFILFTSIVFAEDELGKSPANPIKNANELAQVLGGNNASVDNNTVSLTNHINVNYDLFFSNTTETIVMNLNNFNITLGNENEIMLWSGVKLTITGSGSISNNGKYSTIELFATDNILTIDGPTIENKFQTIQDEQGNITGAAITTDLKSATEGTTNKIEIKSGTIKGTQGINFNVTGTGNLKISGGTIESTVNGGAAIVVNDNNGDGITTEITGGIFNSNETNGIGLVVTGTSNVNITAGEFSGAYGLYASGESNVTISDATIRGTQYGIDGIENSIITILSGNITGNEAGIYSEGQSVDIKDGTIDGRYGVVAFNGVNISIENGNIHGTAAAVSGNGSDENINTSITITGGTIKGDIVGIYHPQVGSLTINGGNITGQVGIVARQGDVYINNGTITATGEPDTEITIGDATDGQDRVQLPSGTAIIVDNSESSYSDIAKVIIKGGEINANANEPVLSYNETEDDDDIIVEVGDTNTGAKFNKNVNSKYLAGGVTLNENNVAVVNADYSGLDESLSEAKGIDKSKYTEESVKKLEEAIKAAEAVDRDLKSDKQSTIDALKQALINAMSLLIEKSSGSNKPSTIPEQNITAPEQNVEEQTPNTYDAGLVYVELSIIALGTTLISIRKLRNN